MPAAARVARHATSLSIATGGALLGAAFAGRFHLLHAQWREDIVLGLATAAFVGARLLAGTRPAGVGAGAGAGVRARYARWATALAGFSYTLYLCHYPPLAFLNAWLAAGRRWQPTPGALAAGAGIAAVVTLYAYGLARVTEGKTEMVRGWVLRARAGKDSPNASATSAAPLDRRT